MCKSVTDIQQAFKQLRLAETAEELPELLRKAEQSSWTYLGVFRGAYHIRTRKTRRKKYSKAIKLGSISIL